MPTASGATSGGASSVVADAGWSSYRDPRYGFVTQYPNDAMFNAPPPQGPTSDDSWLITDSQDASSNATLEVTATTQANASICAQYTTGKPVTVAGNITGYEQDNLASATPPPGAASQPQVAVLFLHGGLFYIITLTAPPPASTFMRRWGGVWNHVLNTFQPGQGPAGAKPCG
ncbi:MAG TPA: hypothetical protein VE338_13935 [Ktedonobacterales bacterium]|jgi:hypothetical protein|nr:hypothetical protein [Ktedonobacterales bacterium]